MGSPTLRGYKSFIRPKEPIYASFPTPNECICTWVFSHFAGQWELKYIWKLCRFHKNVECMSTVLPIAL